MEVDVAGNLKKVLADLPEGVRLVAISKFHPKEYIEAAYNVGQRVFGESHEQEIKEKVEQLPKDIEWHFIGHLQTNKLKLVLPYATLVESVDTLRLLVSIERWGAENARTVSVLLEQHISQDATKQGFTEAEILMVLTQAVRGAFPHIRFCGLMGMATLTDDSGVIHGDFSQLAETFAKAHSMLPELTEFKELSMGMSDDWPLALEHGSTLVRIGTAIFGPREY